MFREGPFPAFLHGIYEYVAGALFIALPLLLGYDSGAATAVSIVIGVVLIGVAASTDWGLSLNNQIPKAAHFALDWVLAGVLIASPFLFGFSDDSTPTAIFIAAGVLHILLTIGTRFGAKAEKTERKARARSSSSKVRSAADDRDAKPSGSATGSSSEGAERRFVSEGEAPAEPSPPAASTSDRSSARRS
jgi:hypothetical protein